MLRHTPWKSTRTHRRAFTLIELLAVIAIIAVLASLTLIGLGRIRDSARSTKCTSNLRQMGAAFQLYAADNRGVYPALRKSQNTASTNPNPSQNNWMVEISPYAFRDVTSTGIADIKKSTEATNVIHCPAYDLLFTNFSEANYAGYQTGGYGMNPNLNIPGVGGNMPYDTRYPAAAIPYPARTVLVGDSGNYHLDVKGTSWTRVSNTAEGYYSGAPTRHGSSANYLFCDGHVTSLAPDAALAALPPRT
jgi:prepilin-type N-terminal cleavage/methylation domain-containing protein/prepilin-type processing-associated H-X9-DG protein